MTLRRWAYLGPSVALMGSPSSGHTQGPGHLSLPRQLAGGRPVPGGDVDGARARRLVGRSGNAVPPSVSVPSVSPAGHPKPSSGTGPSRSSDRRGGIFITLTG